MFILMKITIIALCLLSIYLGYSKYVILLGYSEIIRQIHDGKMEIIRQGEEYIVRVKAHQSK